MENIDDMQTPLLIINGAEGRLNAILACHGKIQASHTVMASSQGAERLTPLLHDMFTQQGLSPNDLSHIACVVGPGSFTGLRLTLATVAALRRTNTRAEGVYLYGINYLQAIATSLPTLNEHATVRVITHARRGLVYMQDFVTTKGAAKIVSDLDVVSIDVALESPHAESPHAKSIENLAETYPAVLVGSGIERNVESIQAYFATHKPPTRLVPASEPTAEAFFTVCPPYGDRAWQTCDLEPEYIRPCDAEDNLAHIATKDGRSPEKAKHDLDVFLQTAPKAMQN